MGVKLVDSHPHRSGKVVAIVASVMRSTLKPLIRRSIQLHRMLVLALVSVVAVSLPGCSFLKDKNAKISEPRALKLGDTACLGDSKKIISGYIEGREPIESVDGMFDCLIKAVTKFTSRTRGESSANGYTLEEIQQFISEYFQGSDGLSSKLLSLGFELKATTIGGRATNVTRVEIEKVKDLLLDIKTALHELDPHMNILLGRSRAFDRIDPAQVDQAVRALDQFVTKVSHRFSTDDGLPITIDRLFDMVATLQKSNTEISKYAAIASNLKSILISGPKDRIRCEEWPALLKASAKIYGILVRHKYGLAKQQLGKGETTQVATAISRQLIDLIRDGLSRNEDKFISGVAVRELILNYEKLSGQLPLNIKSASLDSIYPKIFTNILRPSRISAFANNQAIEKNRAHGVGMVELQALEYYLENWLFGFEVAQELFKDRDSRSGTEMTTELRQRLTVLESNRPSNSSELARWITQKTVLRGYLVTLSPAKRPLLYARVESPNQESQLTAPLITNETREAQYTIDDLIRLNSTRAIVELVLRSFTNDNKRARDVIGLTTDEAEVLYKDMRQIGFDLGVSDPRSQKAGHRTFMEANLFTSDSNGDDYINYREGIEWYNFVSASGKHAIEIFENSQIAADSSETSLDVFGKNKVEVKAFRTHLKENFGRYFSNLPGMAKFVEQLKRQNRYESFEIALETASRPLGHTDAAMDSTTIRTVVPIIYYTESIFNRFDIDKSGILENEEAWAIFPIMRQTIQAVSQGAANTELKQKMVFAQLLLTGQPPPDDWRKYLSSPIDWLKEKYYKPSTDRQGIINLIAAITVTGRKNGIKSIKALYDAKKNTIRQEFQNGFSVLDQLHELSRCSPESIDRFRAVMQRHAPYIFKPNSKGNYNSDLFVRRLQAVIQTDRPNQQNGLHEQCQHMVQLNYR